MKCILNFLLLLGVTWGLLGCGSKPIFKVETVPAKTKVLVISKPGAEPRNIGEAPFTKDEKQMKKAAGNLKSKEGFVELLFEKEGYKTKRLWVPVTASGTLRAFVKVTLDKDEEGTKNLHTVSEILDQMYLAQKFARLKQYERALIEIDKVLDKHPEFPRALTLKGSIYYANGDFKNSLVAYEQALLADPKFEHAMEMSTKVRKQLKLPPRAPASLGGAKK